MFLARAKLTNIIEIYCQIKLCLKVDSTVQMEWCSSILEISMHHFLKSIVNNNTKITNEVLVMKKLFMIACSSFYLIKYFISVHLALNNRNKQFISERYLINAETIQTCLC